MPYKDKQKQREYVRAWRQRRRQAWIDSQGGVCVACGFEERLQIDHIDPRTKTWEIGQIWSRNVYVRHSELKKCQVLCDECHSDKTLKETNGLAHFYGPKNPYWQKPDACDCVDCSSAHQLDLGI